jgi:hypothetical protein
MQAAILVVLRENRFGVEHLPIREDEDVTALW